MHLLTGVSTQALLVEAQVANLNIAHGQLIKCPQSHLGARSEQQFLTQFYFAQAVDFPLVALAATSRSKELVVPAAVSSTALQPIATKGAIRKWPARQLLQAVVASLDDRNLANMEMSTKRKLEFLFGDASEQLWSELQAAGLAIPDRWTLARARINLDIAAVAHTRDLNAARKETSRQLNFDSSPKGGVELLGIRECVVLDADFSQPTVELWPLVTLGFGHASLIDKVAALVHVIYLQAGPSLVEMEHFTASVHVMLTDAGVEHQVVDHPNCMAAMVNGVFDEEAAAGANYLFPVAMQVIDIHHTFDWILKTTCERLPFWNEFLSLSKALTKMLSTKSYVDALVSELQQKVGQEESQQGSAKLRGCTARFAQWRFETLYEVCRDLLHVEQHLKAAWSAEKFHFKDSTMGRKVQEAMTHESFWLWTRILHDISSFCQSHRMWCCGCKCHEEECREAARKHTVFSCPMKSMRGPELHDHLHAAKQSFTEAMCALGSTPELQDSPELQLCVRHSSETLLSCIKLKFGYTAEMPWLLWRVRENPEVASHILREYDSMLAEQKTPHRLHT
eukprot:871517-Amphidinium_carterae.1